MEATLWQGDDSAGAQPGASTHQGSNTDERGRTDQDQPTNKTGAMIPAPGHHGCSSGKGRSQERLLEPPAGDKLPFACWFFKHTAGCFPECSSTPLVGIEDMRNHLRNYHHYSQFNNNLRICKHCYVDLPDEPELVWAHMGECPAYLSEPEDTKIEYSKLESMSEEQAWHKIWDILFHEQRWPDTPYIDAAMSHAALMKAIIDEFKPGRQATQILEALFKDKSTEQCNQLLQSIIMPGLQMQLTKNFSALSIHERPCVALADDGLDDHGFDVDGPGPSHSAPSESSRHTDPPAGDTVLTSATNGDGPDTSMPQNQLSAPDPPQEDADSDAEMDSEPSPPPATRSLRRPCTAGLRPVLTHPKKRGATRKRDPRTSNRVGPYICRCGRKYPRQTACYLRHIMECELPRESGSDYRCQCPFTTKDRKLQLNHVEKRKKGKGCGMKHLDLVHHAEN